MEVGDIDKAMEFYCDLLGCRAGPGEEGWRDIDFWGNELTLHSGGSPRGWTMHGVDMGRVPVPHFGVHLPREVYGAIKQRIAEKGMGYLVPPYVRFQGTEYEQETFFIADPHGNVLELKTLTNTDL
jgi:extradiol dioxygenase family protein